MKKNKILNNSSNEKILNYFPNEKRKNTKTTNEIYHHITLLWSYIIRSSHWHIVYLSKWDLVWRFTGIESIFSLVVMIMLSSKRCIRHRCFTSVSNILIAFRSNRPVSFLIMPVSFLIILWLKINNLII